MKKFSWIALVAALWILVSFDPARAQWQSEWEKVQAAARKEGKVVVNVPPSAELRKALEEALKQKFGIEMEILLSDSAHTVKRAADETKAGVRYFDVITSTWDSLSHTLLPMGAVEPRSEEHTSEL